MPELWSRRPSRAHPGILVARVSALCAAGMLALSTALPAAALGEDGPFAFPAETRTLDMVPGAVTRIPLIALIEDDLEPQVSLGSARLAVPQDADEGLRAQMALGEDSRSIVIAGEGTWTLLGDDLVFQPQIGVDAPSTPIALTIGGFHDSRSLPVVLTPEALELEEVGAHGSAGVPIRIDVEGSVPADGSVRLELAGLPAGSTVLSDGSRATVPDQGVWQLSADGDALTHTPSGVGLGRQLDPIRFVVEDGEGAAVRAGQVMLTLPIISDLSWSAPYGEDILFVVGEGQQFVDPSTLRLQPLGDPASYETSADGARVLVPGEGTWVLDRAAATVRFSPESAEVRKTAPMGITGGDGEGATAATALLSTAYPILLSRAQAGLPGEPISFDLGSGIRDVRSDSLQFDPGLIPEQARVSADGTTLTIPGQGIWQIDVASGIVVMTPEEGFAGAAIPVDVTARGVYADNPVDATLEAVFSPVIATLRDDESRTAPQSPVTVDVLGNDTAGSSSQPLVPESVQISSLAATNLSQLEESRGTRLLIPGEGEYTVAGNGAVTFVPEEGFTGRTTVITYHVVDSEGIPVQANLVIDVDPDLTAAAEAGSEVSGINSLLIGLMPSSPSTAAVFGTVVMLLIFGGGVSLWIGMRMEADRRAWED
ncbi:MAG: Ig-like domain-containing protein [Brachybacterium sp.]|uniref:Ig-like domain-containing protein n=1 Tax=Brachybacterium sp. TaxID=1891286 RepID=UPI003F92E8EA